MSRLSSLFGSNRQPDHAPKERDAPDMEDLSPEALVKLRDARLEIGQGLKETCKKDSYEACPPEAANPFPKVVGQIPEIDAAQLTSDVLAGAIRHHGALIVRGLINDDEAADFRADIDTVLQTNPRALENSDDPSIFNFRDDLPLKHKDIGFAILCGSIFTFLSPRTSEKLLRIFERMSLRSVLQGYFNEEPCVSFKKSVLRRVAPKDGVAEWHQDGAFMNENIASLNVWVALSECGPGTGAPGMKFVPKRLDRVIEETGKNGAYMSWSVSQATVDAKYHGNEAEVTPHFNPGDAILFDHLNLHATDVGPDFTKERYAIETWFFAASRSPENQVSVAWT